jgi:hypothetical protein
MIYILCDHSDAGATPSGCRAAWKRDPRFWHANTFVLLYAISPLSTTALFTAAGMAHANPWNILPGFAIGKFLGDASASCWRRTGSLRATLQLLDQLHLPLQYRTS